MIDLIQEFDVAIRAGRLPSSSLRSRDSTIALSQTPPSSRTRVREEAIVEGSLRKCFEHEKGLLYAGLLFLQTLVTFQKKARVRISMLSRGGASGGLVGSSKAVCAVQRARPSLAESKVLNTIASCRCMLGK